MTRKRENADSLVVKLQLDIRQPIMSMFSGTQSLALGTAGVAIGIGLGLLLCGWWGRRVARVKRRIPKRWPLLPRTVANSQERIAWIWMNRTFFDHSVMIKMPVTRFTIPKSPEQAQHWYQLLSNAYCTFTVVDGFGRVIGCVDLASPIRNNKRSQILKQSLLEQCGIGYVVVDSNHLPDAEEIRFEFMGETASQHRANVRRTAPAVDAASHQLRASLQRQRRTRHSDSDAAPLSIDAAEQSDFPSDFRGGDSHILHSWHGNSFLSPLDSRKADLN